MGNILTPVLAYLVFLVPLLLVIFVLYRLLKFRSGTTKKTRAEAEENQKLPVHETPKKEKHGQDSSGVAHGHGPDVGKWLMWLLVLLVFVLIVRALNNMHPREDYTGQMTVSPPGATRVQAQAEDPCTRNPRKYRPYLASGEWEEQNVVNVQKIRLCLMHIDQLETRCRPAKGNDEEGWGMCNASSNYLQFRARHGNPVSTGAWYLDREGAEIDVVQDS